MCEPAVEGCSERLDSFACATNVSNSSSLEVYCKPPSAFIAGNIHRSDSVAKGGHCRKSERVAEQLSCSRMAGYQQEAAWSFG